MPAVSLTDQIIESEKDVRDCVRRFAILVEKGRLKPETAAQKLEALRAIQSTLTWLEANIGWIRPEYERRRAEAKAAAQRAADFAEAADDASVQAVMTVFPDAELLDVIEKEEAA